MNGKNILWLWVVLAIYLFLLFSTPMMRSALSFGRTAGIVIFVGMVLSWFISKAEKEKQNSKSTPYIISLMAVIPIMVMAFMLFSLPDEAEEKLRTEQHPTCSMFHANQNYDQWWESRKNPV